MGVKKAEYEQIKGKSVSLLTDDEWESIKDVIENGFSDGLWYPRKEHLKPIEKLAEKIKQEFGNKCAKCGVVLTDENNTLKVRFEHCISRNAFASGFCCDKCAKKSGLLTPDKKWDNKICGLSIGKTPHNEVVANLCTDCGHCEHEQCAFCDELLHEISYLKGKINGYREVYAIDVDLS